MAEYQLLSRAGVVKETFQSNIDPGDEDAVIALLRSKARARGLGDGAKIRVKTRKSGWRTYQAR